MGDERILSFEGIHNFRDYGGYPAADGARVRARTLFRSGQHAKASAADLARVAGLGLATVIDLRGDSERAVAPCLRGPDFMAEVLFAPGETAGLRGEAFHEQAASGADSVDSAVAAMVRGYQGMPWRPVLMATLRLYFAALAERPGPSLLHCFAGKDRTGFAAALTHHLLGVHRDDMMADYLLTNSADNERRIAAGAGAIRRNYGLALSDEAVRAVMSVRPEYLEAAFAAVAERHGSLDRYLEDQLGVDAERRAAIRGELLT